MKTLVANNNNLKGFLTLVKERDLLHRKKERMSYWNKKFKELVSTKHLLMTYDKNMAVGFLYYSEDIGPFDGPYIELVYVKKDHRKMGVAKSLFIYLEKISKKKGYKILVSSTETTNKISIKMHKFLKFKQCGYFNKKPKEIFFCKNL